MITVSYGPSPHAYRVRAGLGLRQAVGGHRLAASNRWQIGLLDLLRADEQPRQAGELVDCRNEGCRGTNPSNLLNNDRRRECIGTHTGVRLRNMRRMEIRRYQRFVGCFRKLGQLIGLGGVRGDLLLAQLAHRRTEGLVLLARPIHAGEFVAHPLIVPARASRFGSVAVVVDRRGKSASARSSSVRRRAIYRRSQAGILCLLAHRALDPSPSSSIAEEKAPPLVPPPCGGARFTDARRRGYCACSRIALWIRRRFARRVQRARYASSRSQRVGASGSQSSGSSDGLSTELATSMKARDSTDSAIAIMVSRT